MKWVTLLNHQKTIHEGKRYECTLCEKTFAYKDPLKVHVDFFHNGIGHKMWQIFSYKSPSQTPLHTEGNHNEIGKIPRHLKCDRCDKTFFKQKYLKEHVFAIHENVRNVKCGQCEKAFKTNKALKNHEKHMHQTTKTYSCNHCGKAFMCPSNLRAHVRSIHENITYKCQHCDQSFGY